jgi:hypothetical protein
MHSEEKVLPHSPLFRVHIYHLKESNQNVLVTSMVAADALEIVDTFAACYSAIHVLKRRCCAWHTSLHQKTSAKNFLRTMKYCL